jgi:outer membrane protein OmpA-like peptidoglycan-associated protein
MTRTICISLILLFNFVNSFSQMDKGISDCEGAINIFQSGSFSLQFPSKGGVDNDFSEYPSLSSVSEKKSIWFTFIAPSNGYVSLSAEIKKGNLKMIVFQQQKKDLCEEIHRGTAEIKRLLISKDTNYVGLAIEPKSNQLYPLNLKLGQKISIVLIGDIKSKDMLKFNFSFESISPVQFIEQGNSKIIDLREDEFSPTCYINIKDANTGISVIADLIISKCNEIDGVYSGSDFYFQVDESCKLSIKCDAKGYFFVDREHELSSDSESEITILLDPIKVGKSFTIEQIEFKAGTSEFYKNSEPRLHRLRDFMALNSDIKIEIQGHVFSMEENSMSGQKLSEARALRVYNYLILNGISKNRMTVKGFGNTKPIFPNPKIFLEEQMNRRVEIKIID